MPAMEEKGARIAIRPAAAADAAILLGFVRELAAYEKLSHEAVATEAMLAAALFGPRPFAEALIAEWDGAPVGFALFFHTFSTFVGRPGLYLEDIYVRPAHRRHGVGHALLRELAAIALARDCGRLEWAVLDWNEPAIRFYREKLGARAMDEWTVQRLDRARIKALAESPVIPSTKD
ncbi:MAG TPA: GNAT family N-acetyltransferase [Stellaceae bacterium]|nr:GNAT family N-acetyltransferase [Stellaceae bacterium]